MIRRKRRPVVERTAHGYELNIERDERELVVRLLAELRGLLLSDDPATEPLRRRLFPPAYHLADDAEAEAEYQRLMREDLVASRLEGINLVESALTEGRPLDEGAVQGFMQSLNAVRLVLGTMIDVGEGEDPTELPDDHPMLGEHHLYAYLSWLLEMTVLAVSQPGR
jgi:hypothetical protein